MDEKEIERSILAYLERRPRAADTARGIGNWWLPRHAHVGDPAGIQRALEKLVAAGRLHAVKLPSGDVLYELRAAESPRRKPGSPGSGP